MTELFDKGLKVRKEVLGEEYVNKSIAGADEFTRTMAEWSTEFCWGALWTRPGLDRRTRSIVNLAMLGALNRPSRTEAACQGSAEERPHQGRDQGDSASGRRVLRHPFGHRCVPKRAGSVQRS
ncbi:alkylhydroperoxidase/carboxymuconolactone decarboxylase family protein YurZ [Bradyrhizobium sp. AZCC 1588]